MLIAGTAAVAVLAGSEVLSAQTTTIEIAPEQRTRIKEYVVREKVKPITVRERLAVGATLPADVELVPVPETWGPSVSRYRYVYSDDHVVLSSPQVAGLCKSSTKEMACPLELRTPLWRGSCWNG